MIGAMPNVISRQGTALLLAATIGGTATTTVPIVEQTCRAGVAQSTTKTSAQPGGHTSTTTTTCHYDKANTAVTCNNVYEDNLGTKNKFTSVTTFASVSDVIDEIKSNPPRRFPLTTVTAGPIPTTLTYSYDGERRQTKEVSTTAQGTVYTTTYTSWDKEGRPTKGKTVYTKAPTTEVEIKYNDATKTQTTKAGAGPQVMTCDLIFDENGNPASTSCKSPAGPVTSKSTTTTSATEKICR
jgi:hypothetical protein